MNILFDLNHPVDVNFFKNAIRELANKGHKIVVTYRARGKLKEITEFELGDFSPLEIGKHYSTFIAKIIGQLKRDLIFLFFQREKRINLSVCFGPTNAIASWLNRIPYLAFDDDFEYKIPFYTLISNSRPYIWNFDLFSDIMVQKEAEYITNLHYKTYAADSTLS